METLRAEQQRDTCSFMEPEVQSQTLIAPEDTSSKRRPPAAKNHLCHFCNKCFDRKSLLDRHINTHTRDIVYPCDICHKDFPSAHGLKTHQVIHTDQRPHQCPYCSAAFKAGSNLLCHIKQVHTLDKRHQCTICGKAYCSPGELREHMCRHTGQWPFTCRFCNKGYFKPSLLKKHEKIHDENRHRESTGTAVPESHKSLSSPGDVMSPVTEQAMPSPSTVTTEMPLDARIFALKPEADLVQFPDHSQLLQTMLMTPLLHPLHAAMGFATAKASFASPDFLFRPPRPQDGSTPKSATCHSSLQSLGVSSPSCLPCSPLVPAIKTDPTETNKPHRPTASSTLPSFPFSIDSILSESDFSVE